ncbi:MAG: hypothetical protein NVS1B11_12810 [Terriglobales bacterium]
MIGINIESINASAGKGECKIWSINLVNFTPVKAADSYVERALIEFHLHSFVADIGQGQTGFGVQSQRRSTKF